MSFLQDYQELKFEKVSLNIFITDCLKLLPHLSTDEIIKAYDELQLPQRSTTGAAGYDIRTPFGFTVDENMGSVTVPLGIRAVMPSDKFLMIVPRSGLGFKTGVSLANTVGIIDCDYIHSDNEGHIMLKLVPGFKSLTVQKNDRVAQGIFLQYFTTTNDECKSTRSGGLGSTGVK